MVYRWKSDGRTGQQKQQGQPGNVRNSRAGLKLEYSLYYEYQSKEVNSVSTTQNTPTRSNIEKLFSSSRRNSRAQSGNIE